MQYYYNFWRQQMAIRDSELFASLPGSFKEQVLLDRYWTGLSRVRIGLSIITLLLLI